MRVLKKRQCPRKNPIVPRLSVQLPVRVFSCIAVLFLIANMAVAKSPNVILISIDTLRADHLSCYGYARETSPNIDKFSKSAVLFTDCVTPMSLTLPAHVSMLSGLHPIDHRITTNGWQVPDAIELLPETLKANGYKTIAYVANHVMAKKYNIAQGFDEYTEILPESKLHRGEIISTTFIEWLESYQDDEPFFAFLLYFDVHGPYGAPGAFENYYCKDNPDTAPLKDIEVSKTLRNEWRNSGKYVSDPNLNHMIAKYDEGVAYVDYQIGRVLDKLTELNLTKDTLIIITSDHGEGLGDKKNIFGHGTSVYQNMVHVPLLISFNGDNFKPRKIDYPADLIDITPTILDICGISQPNANGKSESLLAALQAQETTPEDRERYLMNYSDAGQNSRKAILAGGNKVMVDDWNKMKHYWGVKLDYSLTGADKLRIRVDSPYITSLYLHIKSKTNEYKIPMGLNGKEKFDPVDWHTARQDSKDTWQVLETKSLRETIPENELSDLKLNAIVLNSSTATRYEGFFDDLQTEVDGEWKTIASFEKQGEHQWEEVAALSDKNTGKFNLKFNGDSDKNSAEGNRALYFELDYVEHPHGQFKFDLKKDPDELENLYRTNPEHSTALLDKLNTFFEAYTTDSNQQRDEESLEMLKALGYLE